MNKPPGHKVFNGKTKIWTLAVDSKANLVTLMDGHLLK